MAPSAAPDAPDLAAPGPAVALGLDVGGSHCRWALCPMAGERAGERAAERAGAKAGDGDGTARGQAAPWTALQTASDAGRAAIAASLAEVAAAVQAACPGARVAAVVAGITGFDAGQQDAIASLLAAAFAGPAPTAAPVLRLMNDIELACHAAFAPGAGLVLYAGTGSVAAALDDQGRLHRAGGRGLLIDDAGGGAWIAAQALRAVWRAEDERPGAGRHGALARQLSAAVGGSDWAATRAWVYQGPGRDRGALGRLALAVAAAARDGDATAMALLQDAGQELARLALALTRRLGLRPVALAGRVWDLHPAVEAACRTALAAALAQPPAVQRATRPAEVAAAGMAAALAPALAPAIAPPIASADPAAAAVAAAAASANIAPAAPPRP